VVRDFACSRRHQHLLTSSPCTEHKRTETIQDNLNPTFSTPIVVDFFFELIQRIRFDVFDIDHPSAPLDKQDFLGTAETTMAHIVNSQKSTFTAPLLSRSGAPMSSSQWVTANHRVRGSTHLIRSITVRFEEVPEERQIVRMLCIAQSLDNMDFFGKSDPFFVIERKVGTGKVAAYRSEVIKKTLDPAWKEFSVRLNY
jgi:copine 1/2/3